MKDSIILKQPPELLQGQVEQIKELLGNDTFFPKGIHLDDIDRAVRDKIIEGFQIESLELKGQMIPIHSFFSLQSFSESIQTWKHVDSKKALQLPFIALVRESIAEKGTNLGENSNIPSNPTFNLWKRPILRNGRQSYDYYQIPQPVNVDVKYKLHLFTYLQRENNKMDEAILHSFKSMQYYVSIWGHYMPLKLESMNADDEVGEIEKKRYYHHSYELVLKGYLLDEKGFKKVPSIDKIKIKTDSEINQSKECVVESLDLDCDSCLSFKFNRKSGNSKTIRIANDIEFQYDNMSSGSTYGYFLNGVSQSLPFTAQLGDELTVAHNISYRGIIEIKVCGRR